MLKGGDLSNEVDFAGFTRLVDQLEVQATEPDKQAIFSMIDTEGSGTIDVGGLKRALRSSGAIQRMYDDSIKTFGLLLAATLAFDAGLWLLHGGAAAFDFLAAYVVEDSLSVDNLFVFLLIFRYYKVRAARSPPPPSRPPARPLARPTPPPSITPSCAVLQVPPQLVDTCLNYGISGSILLRGVFIFAGLAATSAFAPLLLGFSLFLLVSSYQLLAGGGEEEEGEEALPELVTNLLAALPMTGSFEGERLAVPRADGKGWELTQLTATLVSIALCDVRWLSAPTGLQLPPENSLPMQSACTTHVLRMASRSSLRSTPSLRSSPSRATPSSCTPPTSPPSSGCAASTSSSRWPSPTSSTSRRPWPSCSVSSASSSAPRWRATR